MQVYTKQIFVRVSAYVCVYVCVCVFLSACNRLCTDYTCVTLRENATIIGVCTTFKKTSHKMTFESQKAFELCEYSGVWIQWCRDDRTSNPAGWQRPIGWLICQISTRHSPVQRAKLAPRPLCIQVFFLHMYVVGMPRALSPR